MNTISGACQSVGGMQSTVIAQQEMNASMLIPRNAVLSVLITNAGSAN
jgi:hypothetical protein